MSGQAGGPDMLPDFKLSAGCEQQKAQLSGP